MRSVSSTGILEVFGFDVFLESGASPDDVMPLIEPGTVVEGWQVVIPPGTGQLVGRVDGYHMDDWPMLLDDHTFAPTANPYPIAERHLDQAIDGPVFTPIKLPSGVTLASVGSDFFSRRWVPFSKAAMNPGEAAARVWYRYRGPGEPFEGNARQQIIRNKKR